MRIKEARWPGREEVPRETIVFYPKPEKKTYPRYRSLEKCEDLLPLREDFFENHHRKRRGCPDR